MENEGKPAMVKNIFFLTIWRLDELVQNRKREDPLEAPAVVSLRERGDLCYCGDKEDDSGQGPGVGKKARLSSRLGG